MTTTVPQGPSHPRGGPQGPGRLNRQVDTLFEVEEVGVKQVYTVHCFFNCGHTTRAGDPDSSSAAMEEHYTNQHTRDIDRALGFLGRTRKGHA